MFNKIKTMKKFQFFFTCLLFIPLSVFAESKRDIFPVDRWYAKQFNISVEEAVRRQEVLNIAHKIGKQFEIEKYTFAEISIKYKPSFQIVFNIKRFAHCKELKFLSDKRCSIGKRIQDKVDRAKITKYVDIAFVKNAKADQKLLLDKSRYYLNTFARNNWSTYNWDNDSQTVQFGIIDPIKFEKKLSEANKKLPPYISVIQRKLSFP